MQIIFIARKSTLRTCQTDHTSRKISSPCDFKSDFNLL